jgi:plastocyanin
MNTKTILLVIGAVVILGGGYYLFTAPESIPPDVRPGNDSVGDVAETEDTMPVSYGQVMYMDGGFEPKTVTIQAGESVKFTNHTKEELHVAFGEHTDHTAYPDKKEHSGLEEGESDFIMFPEKGTYEFHNHRNDEHVGTAVVQ